MFFFFLSIIGAGIALPFCYLIQRRFANQVVPGKVLIREAILFGVFLALVAWLQLGRVLTNLIIVIIAVGFVLLEMLLRMAEKATFKADENVES
jgi:Flp pilus assembly protein TadB